MSLIRFTKAELAAAISRGVRQCVFIGPKPVELDSSLSVFEVGESRTGNSDAAFVHTEFASESLQVALQKSEFDRLKSTLVVWVGSTGYRTADAMIASLAFIASLPKGSGVLLDYAVERTASFGSLTHTAMDALASRFAEASGTVKYLIHPQAVAALLQGVGFHQITDLTASPSHLVSATV